jgi:hypothetical protein
MVHKLIEFSLRNRFIVLLVAAGLFAWGIFSINKNPIDAIPDLSENQVIDCCGKLKSITVLLVPDSKQKCNKGTGSGCCDNKYQFFKVKDKHISAAKVSSPVNYFTDLNLLIPSFQQISFATPNIIVADRSHAPPLNSGVSAYIYNCVFRI